MTKTQSLGILFSKAVERLAESLQAPKSDITRDSAIQRFEFCVDLSWKLVKTVLEEEKGILCNSPKDCFRQAYRQGLVKHDATYLLLVDMRNETVHTYNEEIAARIYRRLPVALKQFKSLLKILKRSNQ